MMVTILVVYQGKNQRHSAYERFPDGSLMYFPSHEAAEKYCRQVRLKDRKGFLQVCEIVSGHSDDRIKVEEK